MNFIKKINPVLIFPVLLILLEIVLFITNYKPGTYLIGWDNIMPEFDIKANLIRSFFSIWQEYRGLGVTDGMSHAANLFHTIYIFILSLFLPQSALRYVYIHLTHILGGIGFFFLTRKLTKNNLASFLGSIFYMFNIGVVQMYFAPLEVFATHFAALPIIALFVTNALEKTTRKNILALFLGTLLLSQQAFVPTVFMAFSLLFFFMLLVHVLRGHGFKKASLVFLTVFLASAFWGLPYIYSGTHTGTAIKDSRINEFSSEEIFYRNKTFGDAPSVLSLKGFMLDAIELDPSTYQDTYFMSRWRDFTNSFAYNFAYLALFIMAIGGAVISVIKKRFEFLPYILTGLVAFVFLANDTPVLSTFNNLIRSAFPLLGEAFRFPFTKFITVFAFCLSILLTFGLSFLFDKFRYKYVLFAIFAALVVFISYPSFLGSFTSPFLKEKLPQDYLDLFSQMQELPPQGRVALFPVETFWNWQYRSWGQRGSGFLWYGMPQPILERAFDPWSQYDEQFYNEVSYAVDTQDEALFENVLRKYDIQYIVLDQYLLNTLSKRQINYDSLKLFLAKSPMVKEKAQFNKVILYQTNLNNGWIYQLDQSTTHGVYPNYSFEKEDNIYSLTGNYVVDKNNPGVVNLFPSLYSQKTQDDLEFNVQNTKNEYVLTPKKSLPSNLSGYTLHIPSLFQTEFLLPVKVAFNGSSVTLTPDYPKITIGGKEVVINPEPITIDAQSITGIDSVVFEDTKQEIKSSDNDKYAYLLNPALNTLTLKDNLGNDEVVYFDTSTVKATPTDLKVPVSDNKKVSIKIEKHNSSLSDTDVISANKYIIDKSDKGPFSDSYSQSGAKKTGQSVDLSAVDGSADLNFYLKNLYHEGSYIVFANSKYGSGLPVRFYVDNDTQQIAEAETVLSKTNNESTIIVPKTNNFFQGYGFHFTVKSVGKEKAQSTINNVEVYPFPASFLRNLAFVNYDVYNSQNKNPKVVTDFRRINTATYETYASPNHYIVLSQAYDKGWAAYQITDTQSGIKREFSLFLPFIFGKKISDHTFVNNWENGWLSRDGGHVVIVYLPQYLQYLGLAITGISLVGLSILALTGRKKTPHKLDEVSIL